jgi:hypothetical protein
VATLSGNPDFQTERSDMAKIKSVTIYGIKNCDTMKKARSWLDERGVAYALQDRRD